MKTRWNVICIYTLSFKHFYKFLNSKFKNFKRYNMYQLYIIIIYHNNDINTLFKKCLISKPLKRQMRRAFTFKWSVYVRSYILEDISLMILVILQTGHTGKERILSTRLDPKARPTT